MLKKFTFKRISLCLLLLLLSLILYHYPEEINQDINKINSSKTPIYLIDENDFVAMSNIDDNKDNIIDKIKSIICALTIDSNYELNNGFKPIIPKNTKILSMDINNELLKINFSKEFLNVSEENENKMIEAIIYSLTELKEINKIMIFVEDKHLNELPHSKKKLDIYLDRSYGINKIISIDDIKNTQMTTIYYLAKKDDYYYIPISLISNDEDKVNIIIKNLKNNTFNNSNLLSHLNYQVELMNYEVNNQEIKLNFNNAILENFDGKLKEEVKYAIAYSIRDSLNINNIIFIVDNVIIDNYSLS